MTRLISTAVLGIAAAALAAEKGGASGAGLPGGAAAATPAAGTVTTIAKGIAIPERKRGGKGGGKSPYPFAGLEIGDSFGVIGKSKKNFNSIIYGQNKKFTEPVTNSDGSAKMIKKINRTTKAETLVQEHRPTRVFEAFDVDPKTDPDGASVRIFRMPLPAAAS